jgi:hypothetical protein
MSSELLKSLGLDAINAGTYLGNGSGRARPAVS